MWQMIAQEPTSCALNPTTGHEIEWPLTPLKEKKSLLIVGGGPAGLEAARVGSERGFDVTLWEASDRIGGNLRPASRPDFKHDISDYLSYMKNLAGRLPIDLVFNKQASADDIKNFGADYVILAVGAAMEPLPFEAGTNDDVLTTVQVMDGMEPKGEKILIIGAGVIGCETAVYLARQGKKVILCARQDAPYLDMDVLDHNNSEMLMQMISDAGIHVLRETIPVRMEKDGVIAEQNGFEMKIFMDSLVFSGRMFPKNELTKSLENTNNVLSIGDCAGPDTVMGAVWGGFKAVREIEA
jgi:2-enoate reductase